MAKLEMENRSVVARGQEWGWSGTGSRCSHQEKATGSLLMVLEQFSILVVMVAT